MRRLHPRTCVARRGQGGSWHGQGRCLLTTMLWLWQAQGARSPPCSGSCQPAVQFCADWACALCQAVSAGAAGAPSSSDAGSKRGSPRSPDASGGSPGGAAGALRALFGRRLSGERGSLKRSPSNGQMQPVCPSLLHGEAGLTEGEHMGTVLPQMRMGLLLVLALGVVTGGCRVLELTLADLCLGCADRAR